MSRDRLITCVAVAGGAATMMARKPWLKAGA
jgi:hypothetical protein